MALNSYMRDVLKGCISKCLFILIFQSLTNHQRDLTAGFVITAIILGVNHNIFPTEYKKQTDALTATQRRHPNSHQLTMKASQRRQCHICSVN